MTIKEKAINKIEAKLLTATSKALTYKNEYDSCLKSEEEESMRLAYACYEMHTTEQEIYQYILNALKNDR